MYGSGYKLDKPGGEAGRSWSSGFVLAKELEARWVISKVSVLRVVCPWGLNAHNCGLRPLVTVRGVSPI